MKKLNIWAASFLAVLIVYHTCYGLQTLLPSNVSWLMTIKHDWGGHYLGWLFYKNEGWHFPIGSVHNYFYPVGTNVGFTDSIPLLAIFFKLFSFALLADFQYFGIWLFACHLLAAYFTILLFRLFKVNDLVTFIGVIFIAANPILIYRGLHPALCAHWLLIASLYVYFLDPSVVRPARILRYQFILLIIASLVNPYLCFMVLGFSIFTVIKLCFAEKVMLKKHLIIYITGSVISLVLCWYVTGIMNFSKKEDVGVEGGYGLYGLNLHSLYNSFGFSKFFRGLKQVSPHQYEGYMYLGAGMFFILLVLLVYRIVQLFKRIKKKGNFNLKLSFGNKRLVPLSVLIILFTLFSVSHVVTLNERVLFKIPVPKTIIQLGDIFRASARFFWSAYYLILIFAIIAIARSRMMNTVKLAILGMAVILQLYDTQRIFTYRKLSYGSYEPPIDTKSWKTLISRFDEIVIYPPFATTNLDHMDYQYFCYLAGKTSKPITTGYVARVNNKGVREYNDSLINILEEGRLSPGSLYIVTPANLHHFSFSLQADSGRLNYLDGYYYIFSKRKNDSIVLSLSEQLNNRHKDKIDSVTKALGQRTEFKKIYDLYSVKAGNIRFNIERFKEKDGFLSLAGWGFKDSTRNSRNDSVFFILKGEKDLYAAPALVQSRPDVTIHFNGQYLDNAGFTAIIFNKQVEKGIYTLSIAIKDKNGILTYMSTEKIIKVHIAEYAALKKTDNWPPMADIAFNAETIRTDDKMILVQGWAFFKEQDAGESRIGIVIKKEENLYLSFADPMLRPDVTSHFNNRYDLDHSGFSIKILKSALPKGSYQLGIFIEDHVKKKRGMIFTGKEIDF